jgi:PAS domain S-box-containing protein
MEEMTGVRTEEILGTGDFSYAIPFYGERRPLLLNRLLEESVEIEREYPGTRRKDHKLISEIFAPFLCGGKGAHLWLIASPLYDAKGTITGAIESVRDVTELKRIKDELVRRNEDLHAAYEQLTAADEELRQNCDEISRKEQELYSAALFPMQNPLPVMRANDQGVVLYANSASGFVLECWNTSPHGSLPPRIRSHVLGSLTEGSSRMVEEMCGPITYSIMVTPIPDQRYVNLYFSDITERKRLEGALEESEKKYRTIFENTGTATVLVEENTVISLANREFECLSGYSRQEIEGKKSWTEFVVKEDLEKMLAQHRLRREKREAALKHYEFRFVTKSGDIRNIFLTIDMIPGTKRSVASLMDITGH